PRPECLPRRRHRTIDLRGRGSPAFPHRPPRRRVGGRERRPRAVGPVRSDQVPPHHYATLLTTDSGTALALATEGRSGANRTASPCFTPSALAHAALILAPQSGAVSTAPVHARNSARALLTNCSSPANSPPTTS